MSIRNLTIKTSTNLGAQREFNHLRISNLEEFLKSYTNNIEFYRSPYQILEDLESQIKFVNDPPETLLITYKDEGDIIFDLVGVSLSSRDVRIVEYQYSTSISG